MGSAFSNAISDFEQRIVIYSFIIATQFYSPDQVRMMAGQRSGWSLFAPRIPSVLLIILFSYLGESYKS